MYCLLLQIFMFQLSSAFNPASTTNANLDPFEGSEVHCAYRYISLNTLHWNQGRSRALAHQHFGKCVRMLVGRGGIFYFVWHMATILWVTEFSALKQNNFSYQDVWSFFVCLFVCLFVLFLFFVFFLLVFVLLVSFASSHSSCALRKLFPHFLIHF